MTAFYAFRITFRVLYGEPCPEAKELEEGHLAHAEPANPMTGEPEDTDVGFPGPGHYIAERATPMKIAMGMLGFLATVAGVLQIPGVDRRRGHLPRADVRGLAAVAHPPLDSAAYIGLAVGAAMAAIGIGIAYYLYVVAPGTTDRIRARARRAPHLPLAQVVLRRALRRGLLPPAARDRALRQLGRRARRRRRAGRARRWTRCAASACSCVAPSRGSSAPTRCF